MSITNIQILHDLAETSLASYANLTTDQALADKLQVKNTGASFTLEQTSQFTKNYAIPGQANRQKSLRPARHRV
jgi:hypothetical protein